MKTFFVILFISGLVIAGIYYFFHGFEDLQISQTAKGPYTIIYQKIDKEDARLDFLLDNVRAYLEREKNIYPETTFEFFGNFPGEVGKVRLTGFIINNETIKGKLRKDIKLKTFIRTDCIAGSFPYVNNLSDMIFTYLKKNEFDEYLFVNNYKNSQILKITNKNKGLIEIMVPEHEWKIK